MTTQIPTDQKQIVRAMAFACYWSHYHLDFCPHETAEVWGEELDRAAENARLACEAAAGREILKSEWDYWRLVAGCWNYNLDSDTPLMPVTEEQWALAERLAAEESPRAI